MFRNVKVKPEDLKGKTLYRSEPFRSNREAQKKHESFRSDCEGKVVKKHPEQIELLVKAIATNLPSYTKEPEGSKPIQYWCENVQAEKHELALEFLDAGEENDKTNLIHIFVWEKFEPKLHNKKMIEDYLNRWELNQGVSFQRKKTVDELEGKYLELTKIYNRSSGGVIKNWENKWENFRDARAGD